MRQTATVTIVGAGFAGLNMAIQLQQAGIHDFVILEKADEVGGVWRENTYPGCECDVESSVYSFSYEPSHHWSKSFGGQPEILEYLKRVADKRGLRQHLRLGVEVTRTSWDEDEQVWRVATASGDEYVSQFVAYSVGAMNKPMIPRLKGIRSFKGQAWHSAEWRHDVDLAGKRVAVVGTGASAIQIIPKIAAEVGALTVFQRTPPWVLPKPDRKLAGWARAVLRALPIAMHARRTRRYWIRELIGLRHTNPRLVAMYERKARRFMADQIADPDLRARLTPTYRLGCKRVLMHNDYYPVFNRDNVDLVTEGVAEVRADSVVDSAGVEHQVDAIVYSTGFQAPMRSLTVSGRDGHNLMRDWMSDGASAHRGLTLPGYPNMFFLLGPNTGLGHNSVVFMIEAQSRLAVQAIKLVRAKGVAAIDTRPEAHQRYQAEIQGKLTASVWSVGGCESWYLDPSGTNRTLWPGGSWRYRLQTRKLDEREFELLPRRDLAPTPADDPPAEDAVLA